MDSYYQRQLNLIGNEGQKLLSESRVLIVGAGGLGHPCATYLAGAGVGEIHLVDYDTVDETNLHRQVQFKYSDIGYKKVQILAEALRKQNPSLKIHAHDTAFNMNTAKILLQDIDLVLDGSDNLTTKFLVHEFCFQYKIPLIIGGISQWQGQLHYFDFKDSSPCFECLYPVKPDEGCVGSCAEEGIMGSTAGVFGSLMAHQALLVLLKKESLNAGESFLFDLETFETQKIRFKKNSHCSLCLPSNKREMNNYEVLSPQEISDCKLVDLTSHSDFKLDKNTKFVFVCRRGIRSLALVKDLRSQGFDKVWSLRGGIASLLIHSKV